jgi:primosomal protein N' (replication factor Y) (superfamily II helicase)
LSGPVDVCVAVPRLELDRPFTYLLSEELEAGTGSLVSVPFHGRSVRGWVTGPAEQPHAGRLLRVRKIFGAVRFFDEPTLEFLRWVALRYIAPLATVIDRSHPPRVAGEERDLAPRVAGEQERQPPGAAARRPATDPVLAKYGADLLAAGRVSWLRPLPHEEVGACVAAVEACQALGKRAIVLVPEADPVPATAAAVLERLGGAAVSFLGGSARARYRTWLEIQAGHFDVVVATRPGVFAPLEDLGLIWISREVHPGHREDRAPYYHVADVASARARIHGAACVLSALSPSVETASGVAAGSIAVARPARALERAASPLVETTAPEAEDRSARLGRLLKDATSAALIVSRGGYGVARVCRSCGEPAACATCRGPIVIERGRAVCRTCGADGVCFKCGGIAFGVERGGAERIAEWAARMASVPVDSPSEGAGGNHPPVGGRILVGTAAAVKDVGARSLDLVAILDPDRALGRAGFHAGEQALATWMEAAAWTAPKARGGRVLAQTRHPGHPAIQALVRWEPTPFLLAEAGKRAEAGFPPGHAVFRIEGVESLSDDLRSAGASVVVAGRREDRTVCLVTARPEGLAWLRGEVLRLIDAGTATRVEAEPQL